MIDNDEVLIKGLKRGNRAAQERFYEKYHPIVWGQCCKMLRDPTDADDVASMALAKAMMKIGKFQQKSTLNSWLYRIVMNECLMELRVRKSRNKLIEDVPEACRRRKEGSYEILNDPYLRYWINEDLSNIETKYRQSLITFGVLELTLKESTAVLCTTPGAYKSRLHRARLLIKQRLAA